MKLSKLLTFAALVCLLVVAGLFWTINYVNAPSISELTESIQNTEPTLYNQLVPDTDLPPEGTRSLFDHLMTQNEGLPYPFSEFITFFKTANPDSIAPLTLLIPNGRSLLKGQADNTLPRILLAPDFQEPNTAAGLGMNTQGQLFMGFVEAANEIEVVSYNEAAGRFEYQLVQNYCEGCVPRIVYARRAICLTCHQGGTPIFSQRPWDETNGQLTVSSTISKVRGNHHDYWGAPIKQALATPERFDELTDIGNFFITSQGIWLDGCGEAGNECRRKLLSLALRFADQPGLFDAESAEVQALRKLWENTFPEKGIQVAESDLNNRNPSGESNGFTDWLYTTFTPDIQFGEGAKDNEDLSSFEKLPPLSPALDPLTIRAPKTTLYKMDIDGVYGIARFFTDDDLVSLNKHFAYDLEALLSSVEALPDELFDARPFSRVKVMTALLGSSQQYCCLNTSEMSPPRASGVPELAIEQHPDLKLFEQYCFTCHRGNPAKRLDFMSGDSEQQVLENIQAKSEIREALDWERYLNTDKASQLMPPRDSVQYRKLKQANEQERQTMRDTVPSMFNF
jgi:hypothetical protein